MNDVFKAKQKKLNLKKESLRNLGGPALFLQEMQQIQGGTSPALTSVLSFSLASLTGVTLTEPLEPRLRTYFRCVDRILLIGVDG